MQIRNLEEELGVALLERHSRGVRATSSGELLSRHAEDILARVEAAKRAVRTLGEGDAWTIRIGLTPSLVRMVGDDILTELSEMLPDVTLNVVEEFSFILMRQMERGELDCALTFSEETSPRYRRRALLEEELYFLSASGEGLAEETIAFKEAVGRDLALTAKQDVVTRALAQIAERLGVRVNAAYEVQSIRAVKNLVAKGIAETIMPYGAAESEIQNGKFAVRRIVSPAVVRTLALVAPGEAHPAIVTERFDAFVDAVADRLHAAEGPLTRRL